MKKKTKRNTADLTTRNARAYNKRFLLIEEKISELMYEIDSIAEEINDTNHQLKKIMTYFQQYFTGKKK